MDLDEELKRIAAAAWQLAAAGEELAGVIPTEPEAGRRVYLCAFQGASRTWLALDDGALPVDDRALVRSAVSIAALCELAEESAGGGKLEELRAQLVSLRLTEQPEGRTLGGTPRLATPAYLDSVGTATRRLEQALGEGLGSPFVEAMRHASAVVEELEREVVAGYKGELR